MENSAFELQDDMPGKPHLPVIKVNSVQIEMSNYGSADESADNHPKSQLMYAIEDIPPWYLTFFLGLQHFLTMFGATVSIPYLLSPALCIGPDDPARAYIISTIIFVSGMITFLQTTFGVRLPIVQGGTFSFLVPTFAILSLPEWKCPEGMAEATSKSNSTQYSQEEKDAAWHERICEVQGAIILAGVLEMIIGATGFVGVILKFITPLVIASVITLVGLALFENAASLSSGNWPIAVVTFTLIIIFSLYLTNISLPMGTCTRKQGFKVVMIPVFKLFPVLLALVIMWIICVILTSTNALSDSDPARTDTKLNILNGAPWIRFPYPFQWGLPTFSFAAALGMLGGVMATIIESIGDYYACAKLSEAPPPPVHAINRGMTVEGIGTILAGLWGTGNGTTSYGENIGVIGVTKVGSRRVLQTAAVIMMLFGLMSKCGALFVTIPEPLIGGVFFVTFSMITAIGLSQTQYVNLNSPRNLMVLGFPIFCGLAIPKWLEQHKGVISTGSVELDNILEVLLSTSMFVGGFLAIIMDNTIPGTDEERGLTKWSQSHGASGNEDNERSLASYDLPCGMKRIKSWAFAKYIPISPTFDTSLYKCKRNRHS